MKGWISLDLQEGVSLLLSAVLLLQVQLLQLQGVWGSDTRCKFPREWKGRWYQSGLGDVNIRQSSITNKGICADHHRDYYLVHNKEDNCYHCLLMMKRHKNIIQYKESYCVPKDSLHRICATIRVESMLHTLVREPHNAVKCPFQDAYYFDYNDNMYGFCDNPISYAKPCAGESRFHFHFKHCASLAFLHGEDFDFDCVATWKDGSDMYMFGKWSGSSVLTRDDSYRCFMFESYGSEVYMSMSADSTCRGLRTTKDGPLVLKFTKDIYGWPQASCGFPDWINHDMWRDLSGQYRVEVDTKNRGRLIIHYKKRPTSREQVRTELRCIEVLAHNTTHKSFVALSFTSAACVSQHQCVMITQKDQDVMEIKLGKLADYGIAKACLQTDKDYRDSHLLFPLTRRGVDCPLRGVYQVTSGERNCAGRLISGCNRTQQMNIRCGPKQSSNTLDITLECLSTWRQPEKTLILVRNVNYETGPIGCIKLISHSNYLEFSSEDACYGGVSPLFNAPISFAISSIPETCVSAVEYIDVGKPTDKPNTVESDETFIDYTDEYEEEEVVDIDKDFSTTTPKQVAHIGDREVDDNEDEEEQEEYSSFYPDELEQSVEDQELEDNLIVETLPESNGHHNDTSNIPKGPYVHVGRSRKPKSKSTSSSSANVVRTNNDQNEQSSGTDSMATVHTSSSIMCVFTASLTLTTIHFLLPTR